MSPIDFIEMINGWCNDYVGGDENMDANDLINTIQAKTQEYLDKEKRND